MRGRCTRGIVLTAVLLVSAVAGIASAAAVSGDPGDALSARSYEVRYRPLSDAVELVEPVLSPEGQVSIQPRLGRLVVQDRISVLNRIADLLESFDLPPRNVEVTVSLFMGSDTRKTEAGRHAPPLSISSEVRGVIESLKDFTKWVEYDPLGSRAISCVENSEVRTDLTDGYRVQFTVDAVDANRDTITFRSFTLQKVHLTVDGTERVENLYSARIAVNSGRPFMLVAAKGPDSKRALFLAIQADPR